jgi:hypothetical protein
MGCTSENDHDSTRRRAGRPSRPLLCLEKYLHSLRPAPYNEPVATVRPIRPQPVGLHAHALDNLEYIRATMERAASFTAVPGAGGIAIGGTALLAAGLAARAWSVSSWLAIWLGEAVLACLIGVAGAARKSRQVNVPLLSGPGRKFLSGFAPPLLAGAILTLVLYRAGVPAALPGAWLLLYGTGVLCGGAASVKVVPVMGICFMIAGTLALFAPGAWGNFFLAAGFGGIHILFGILISVKYGG